MPEEREHLRSIGRSAYISVYNLVCNYVASRYRFDMSKMLESPTIRISRQSKATLRELADHEDKPMQTVLDDAIEQYRRDRFFRELDEDYARLQTDDKAWQEELGERRLWDTTVADGLNSE